MPHTGARYGRLVVLERAGSAKYRGYSRALWLCQCDCGKTIITSTRSLESAHTRSCGCLLDESRKALRLRRSAKSPVLGSEDRDNWNALRAIWKGMRFRCYNTNCDEYHRYGGRGIKICEEWRYKSKPFILWGLANGYKKGLSIDRINNDGDYEPSNCQFMTRNDNSRKGRQKMITIDGVSLSQSEWSAIAYNGNPHRFTDDKCRKGYDLAYSKLIESLKRFDYA